MTETARPTALDIRRALRKRFPSPRCAIAFEVARGTGYSAKRHLDAVAMELWPSHGLALHGIEIKVSRSDWRRERDEPAKAEEVARHLDFFWVAAPKGVVPADELPTAWGLLELDGEGLNAPKQATKTEAAPLDRLFLAALFRAANRPVSAEELDDGLARRLKELESDFDRRVVSEVALKREGYNRAAESWEKLVAAVAPESATFYHDEELIRAVKVVFDSGIASSWKGVQTILEAIDDLRDRIAEALKLPTTDDASTLKRHLRRNGRGMRL